MKLVLEVGFNWSSSYWWALKLVMFCPIASIGSRNLKRKKDWYDTWRKEGNQHAIAHEFNKMHMGKNVKHNIMSIVLKDASTIMAINTITSRSKRNKNVMYMGQNMTGYHIWNTRTLTILKLAFSQNLRCIFNFSLIFMSIEINFLQML